MRERSDDPRLWRLFDLNDDETIVVRCLCQNGTVSYGPGDLQRRRRLPSDTLIFDLQYRLRCIQCGRTRGFAISVSRLRTDRSNLSGERTAETLVVPGG